jgi:hypothetical protein
VSTKVEHPAEFTGEEASPQVVADLQVRVYSALDELPAGYAPLFEEASQQQFFLSLPWFQNFVNTALDRASRIRIYGIGDAEGMFLARSSPPGRNLFALTNFYSCMYGPHVMGPGEQIRFRLRTLANGIGAERPRWETVEIQPLDASSEVPATLVEAFRESGFIVQTFFCFGNWYLPVEGRSFKQYMESRPPILKNTLSRKRKKLEKSGRAKIRIVTGGDDVEDAIEAYTKVYISSWKQPEPYPEFIPGLIRTCANMGTLRLGLVYVDGEPAAAQLWIVHQGCALIYKLAYDERFADLSVGTVLTATMMEHVLDVDRVREVDYLSGDDAYKKDWMSHRRERSGLLAMNPRTVGGAVAICRHIGGRTMKKAATWLSSRWRERKAN